jgi:hypothetical protein
VTFTEWWKAGTDATKVPLYGEANAKKAWDYQQKRIDELEEAMAEVEDVYRCARSMNGGHNRETIKLTDALAKAGRLI